MYDSDNNNFIEIDDCPVCKIFADHKMLFSINYKSRKMLDLNSITEIPDIKLLKCKKCNHSFASPIINPSIIDNYYSNINSELYLSASENPIDSRIKERGKIVSLISNLNIEGRAILDVGCGYGFLLSYLDNKWDCYGVEPSKYASKIAEAKGVKIISNNIVDVNYSEYKFDAILVTDVLEHIPEPNVAINKIYNLLKRNGYLIIETGNIDSFNARIGKHRWSYFCSFEHISFYNPSSIRFLLEKNGFTILNIKKIAHQKGFIDNSFVILKNIIKYLLFKTLKHRVNCSSINTAHLAFDHLLVIAKKL